MSIEVIKGDITTMDSDAIVNAANSTLLGGGGVDGAIHRAAGPQLLKACKKLNGCETGKAKITDGFNLPAQYVIHTVGPVWRGGLNNEENLLAACYTSSLNLAKENNCKTVAFPNISTGVYRFPKESAAKIAIDTVQQFVALNPVFDQITFVCFDDENLRIYKQTLGE